MKGRGRPSKHAKCNITRLQNQGIKGVPVTAEDPDTLQPDLEASHSESKDELGSHVETTLDSIVHLEVDSDYDVEDNINERWDEIATQEFNNALISLTIQIEEDKRDVADEDWLSTCQQKDCQLKLNSFLKEHQNILSRFEEAGLTPSESDKPEKAALICDCDSDSDDDTPVEADYDPNDWDHILDEMLNANMENNGETA
ncbi:hypothetical protein ARMGADRAFT_1035824 [Armillaria gallica]|uniref:Uncharacterized protein n=1 Tax=Armillaria gallica TaxID=47427 RepID=A0A2H3CSU2_ARMGA|nr:hypothetical protein ARMGADRAFT_1035824 [Armillaria gallica]